MPYAASDQLTPLQTLLNNPRPSLMIARATTGTSIPNNSTATTVTNWSVEVDNGSISYGSGQFTLGEAGDYLVSANVLFPTGNASGWRRAEWKVNGNGINAIIQVSAFSGSAVIGITTLIRVSAGAVLELQASHNDSGGSLSVTGRATIVRIGDGS